MTEPLTEENFLLYCAKHYDGRYCSSTADFYEDINRIKYIKKLITRYINKGDLQYRLILNHIIILNNVFGPQHISKILYCKLSNEFSYIKPFLVLLKILPDKLYDINTVSIIDMDLISMDQTIIEILRKI